MKNYLLVLSLGILMVGAGCNTQPQIQINTVASPTTSIQTPVPASTNSPVTPISNDTREPATSSSSTDFTVWKWKPTKGFEKFGKLTFTYPKSFEVILPDKPQVARLKDVLVIIEKGDGPYVPRLDIFQKKDLGGRLKFIEELKNNTQLTPGMADEGIPKEQLSTIIDGEEFQVWFYYNESNILGKNDLHAIFNSIKSR